MLLKKYLEKAEDFLKANNTYSAYLGRYFTLCKPIFGLHRSTHLRSRITECDIFYSQVERRINLLSHLLIAGCSPVFYGVRRVIDFKNSLELQSKFKIETTQELCDQIFLASKGKIKFSDELICYVMKQKLDTLIIAKTGSRNLL